MPTARFSRTLIHAITSSLLSRGVALIAPFLIMPAMLDHLGPTGFGVWVTGVSVVSLAAFMDFGIGNSLLTRLATHFGRGDTAAARRDIGASYRMLGLVFLGGLGLLLFGLTLMQFCPRGRSSLSEGEGGLILVTLLFFLAGLPLTIVYRILYAHQQISLYNVILIAGAALSVLLTLSAVWIGLPGWMVVAIYSGAPVVLMLIATFWYFRAYPQYRPRRQDFRYDDEARALLYLGLGHLGLGILTAVGMNVDLPLILYIQGSDAVADFAMPARVGSVLMTVMLTVFMPLWSFNGVAMARQDQAWVRRNTIRMSIGGGIAIAVLGGLLTLAIGPIMLLWVGKAFPSQALVIATMAIPTTVIAFVAPWNMVLNSAGAVRIQIWSWSAFVVISIAGKILLLPQQGAWIVSVVTALSYALCIAPVVLIAALRLTR